MQSSNLNQFHKLHHLSAELASRRLDGQHITYCGTQLVFYHFQNSRDLIDWDFYSVPLVQSHLKNWRQQSHSFQLLILAHQMSLAFTLRCCLSSLKQKSSGYRPMCYFRPASLPKGFWYYLCRKSTNYLSSRRFSDFDEFSWQCRCNHERVWSRKSPLCSVRWK